MLLLIFSPGDAGLLPRSSFLFFSGVALLCPPPSFCSFCSSSHPDCSSPSLLLAFCTGASSWLSLLFTLRKRTSETHVSERVALPASWKFAEDSRKGEAEGDFWSKEYWTARKYFPHSQQSVFFCVDSLKSLFVTPATICVHSLKERQEHFFRSKCKKELNSPVYPSFCVKHLSYVWVIYSLCCKTCAQVLKVCRKNTVFADFARNIEDHQAIQVNTCSGELA